MNKIYRETVSDILWETLEQLMNLELLNNFRLVGGTSLSLILGHRLSIDIDMFTDAEYGSIDFKRILDCIKKEFTHVEAENWSTNTMGNTCYLGKDKDNIVKLDLFYTDPFVYPIIEVGNIRLSYLEEIAAMKLEVIGNGGRKKDFWDIHALLDHFSINEMIEFYIKRYPYNHTPEDIKRQLTNFEKAENDFEPICLKGKYWELIKLDIEESIG